MMLTDNRVCGKHIRTNVAVALIVAATALAADRHLIVAGALAQAAATPPSVTVSTPLQREIV
jgi:hypothetical protein